MVNKLSVEMEFIRNSPARFKSFKDKVSCEVLAKQRQYEALNLSARKLTQQSKISEIKVAKSSRELFNQSEVRNKIQENFKSLKEAFDIIQSPTKNTSTKRKFSFILNDNRTNFEKVDLDVDLCFSPLEEIGTSGPHNKKLRMSV